MELRNKEYMLVNISKRIIMEPKKRTWKEKSDGIGISYVDPEGGNPFHYDFYHQLMNEWKGDQIAVIEDSLDNRDYLIHEDGYEYFKEYGKSPKRKVYEDNHIKVVSYKEVDLEKWKKQWQKFMDKYVIINYDDHLFMTIDQRLFKRTKNLMPFFMLATVGDDIESSGNWATCRIGIEPIDTPTLKDGTYIEMFRMIGDKSLCRILVEEHRQHLKGF